MRASHILISAQGQACICGLRYSCEVVNSGKWQRTIFSFPKSSTNNLKWLSPEVLQQDLRGYNEKSDIYSLGMTICELANGTVPFSDVSLAIMLTEKVRGSTPNIIDRSTFPVDVMDTEQCIYMILVFYTTLNVQSKRGIRNQLIFFQHLKIN